MIVALIRGGTREREHIVTQPAHRAPSGAPVSHWTLCNRVVNHGPDTTIRGPLESNTISADGDLCLRCERVAEMVEMAERYARNMEGGAA